MPFQYLIVPLSISLTRHCLFASEQTNQKTWWGDGTPKKTTSIAINLTSFSNFQTKAKWFCVWAPRIHISTASGSGSLAFEPRECVIRLISVQTQCHEDDEKFANKASFRLVMNSVRFWNMCVPISTRPDEEKFVVILLTENVAKRNNGQIRSFRELEPRRSRLTIFSWKIFCWVGKSVLKLVCNPLRSYQGVPVFSSNAAEDSSHTVTETSCNSQSPSTILPSRPITFWNSTQLPSSISSKSPCL